MKTCKIFMTLCAVLAGCLFVMPAYAQITPGLAELLERDRHYLFLRHAVAPGLGDPDGFDIDICTTQRNLSPQGIMQAQAIGNELRRRGVSFDRVFTSQWCRCIDTAVNLGMGEVEELLPLNSVWTRSKDVAEAQFEDLQEFIESLPPQQDAVFVTHYANILAFTAEAVGSGEGVIVHYDQGLLNVVGRLDQ